MHAYRVFLEGKEDIGVRLHSDRLIESFGEISQSEEKEVKAFIECLWRVRYQFDRYVVKWVKADEDDE